MLFYVLFTFVIMQRLFELVIAKRNERYLKRQGAYEVGKVHYKWIVLLHVMFLLVLYMEVLVFQRGLASWFWVPLTLFLLAQVGRVWAIRSLGPFWNTKIIILPGADVVAKGPYKYIRHPNYLIVAIELISLPLIFQAYFTAVVFTFLNAVMILGVRLPDEEKALLEKTNYKTSMGGRRRFVPRRMK